MTDEMMTLKALLEKSADSDLLREMIGFTARRLMELEVEGLTGAAPGAKSSSEEQFTPGIGRRHTAPVSAWEPALPYPTAPSSARRPPSQRS